MQVRVTVALATICLVLGAVGASTLHSFHLTGDQYSPLLPQRHGVVYQKREDEAKLTNQNKVLDVPQDYRSIADPRSSIISNGIPNFLMRTSEVDSSREENLVSREEKAAASFKNHFTTLKRENEGKSSAGAESKNDAADYRDVKEFDSFSLDTNPPAELEEPFVADDTFQDQGPGSVEIYKLDLFKEKTLLNPPLSTLNLPWKKAKSKVPKKSSRVDWKNKSTDYDKWSSSTKSDREQSTFPDELKSQSPSTNGEDFGVGGVPELQVGCEGLEASSHKLKRSVDALRKEKNETTTKANTVSFNFDYDLLPYEETDELLLLKKMESARDKAKERRGDIGISFNPNYFPYLHHLDKSPARGDLGTANSPVIAEIVGTALPRPSDSDYKSSVRKRSTAKTSERSEKAAKASFVKSEDWRSAESSTLVRKQRKLLWVDGSNDGAPERKDVERERRGRSTLWGFDENEGVVSGDELQTEERRKAYKHNHREGEGEEEAKNRANTEIERIREEYEKLLEQQRQQTEERWRRMKEKESRRLMSNREREKGRRREEEPYDYGRDDSSRSTKETAEEIRRRWEEERRRREEEKKKLREEQLRRRSHSRSWQKAEREEGSVENFERNLTPEESRSLEERRRQWVLKRMQEEEKRIREEEEEEEEERRRQEAEERRWNGNQPWNAAAPSNLLRAESRAAQLMPSRVNEGREETNRWKVESEREKEKKLREYVERNRPINLNARHQYRTYEMQRNMTQNRSAEEHHRRRMEEEKRLQEYVRRRQPIDPLRERTNNSTPFRRDPPLEERRAIEAARSLHNTIAPPRYPSSQEAARRHHGPSASAYIDPPYSLDESRKRQENVQRLKEEERRRMRYEAARREEEVRKEQSRRYEEERRRIEGARREEERRRQEPIEEQRRRAYVARRKQQQQQQQQQHSEGGKPDSVDRRELEVRRRQDAALVPANLVLNENRRAIERARQRQEQAARRAEAVARDNEGRRLLQNRTKEEKEREEHMTLLKEQWRRQEEARLNALPVSARIILRSRESSPLSPPVVISRDGFRNEIDFPGINPHGSGVEASRFPAPPTSRPPVKSPGPCTWAIVHCCPSNTNRLVTCFESLGCPGISWDGNPCRFSIAQAARDEIARFYSASQDYY